MVDLVTAIGAVAALCTTALYFPQLKKCWETGEAKDLSLGMFSVLSIGIPLWVIYGLLKKDWIIIAANSVSLSCLFGILFFKLRNG
jgi:MtN3 and saliva related transmembrane protein